MKSTKVLSKLDKSAVKKRALVDRLQNRTKKSADPLTQWIEKMRDSGSKLTPTRAAILECLIGRHELLGIDDLIALIKEQNLLGTEKSDYTTVYRCLLKFEEAGLVVSTELGDGISRYELTDGEHHHHHVICKSCKEVKPIDDCGVDKIESLVKKMGYNDVQHRLELFGVCLRCQKGL
jgi:Fur family ferric uptake transcriptional regulator